MTKTIEVSPGKGWRWLEDDEVIQKGDEIFVYTEARFMSPTTRLGKKVGLDGPDGFPVRRRVEVESPDDWVVQDRVPPRDGIDEYLIENIHMWYVKKKGFEAITLKHGDMVGDIGMLKVRCHRKDLPPLPAPPAEEQCVMCDSPAVPGTASCGDCYQFALESVGAPIEKVDPARRALEQIAGSYGIKDFETMTPDQIVERITAETQRLATVVGREVEYNMRRYDDLFEEMKKTISRMEQRLNKMEGVMVPQMIISPGR